MSKNDRFIPFEIDNIDFMGKCKWCFQFEGEKPNVFTLTYCFQTNSHYYIKRMGTDVED